MNYLRVTQYFEGENGMEDHIFACNVWEDDDHNRAWIETYKDNAIHSPHPNLRLKIEYLVSEKVEIFEPANPEKLEDIV
jgi:heme-degrading monooxygenase HmoA